jgi:type II secretory pathway component PulF
MFSRREMPPQILADMLGRLATALAAGIDLRRAWQSEVGRVPAAWRGRMTAVAEQLAAGKPLAAALSAAGDTFPPLVRGMAELGDRTGRDVDVLRELAETMRRLVRFRRALRQSLVGPAFQLAVALAVVALLILVAGFTRHDMLGLGLRGVPGLIAFAGIVAAVAAAARLLVWLAVADWRRRGPVRTLVSLVPVAGPALRAAEAAAWCRAASLAAGAGLDAGRVTALGAAVAPGLAVDAAALEERLRGGDTLAEALDRTRRFPHRLLEMLAVGEATGTTAEVLDRLAEAYDLEAADGLRLAIRGIGMLVWAAVAALVALIVVRVFSDYVRLIRQAAG